jgi:hypothetical protein
MAGRRCRGRRLFRCHSICRRKTWNCIADVCAKGMPGAIDGQPAVGRARPLFPSLGSKSAVQPPEIIHASLFDFDILLLSRSIQEEVQFPVEFFHSTDVSPNGQVASAPVGQSIYPYGCEMHPVDLFFLHLRNQIRRIRIIRMARRRICVNQG